MKLCDCQILFCLSSPRQLCIFEQLDVDRSIRDGYDGFDPELFLGGESGCKEPGGGRLFKVISIGR
jgi:hypothetical protein